ncbi:hypothetical protein RI054_03g14410 [Pseudoscourfieldia marina]
MPHGKDGDRAKAEEKYAELFGGVVKPGMTERQAMYVALAQVLLTEGDNAANRQWEALQNKRASGGNTSKKGEKSTSKDGKRPMAEQECSGYGALRKMVGGVKPTGVAAVGAAPGAGRYQSGGAGNAENTPGTGTGIQRREGDWDRGACGFAGNFAFRETCFRCRAAKGSSGGGAHAGLGSNANVDAGSTTKDAEGDKEAKERRRSQIAAVTQQLEALAAEVKKTGEGFNAQLAAEAMHVAAAMPTSFEPLEVAEEMEPEGKTSATKRAKPTNEGMGKSVRLTGCQVPGRGVLELRWTAESEESAEAPMSKEELQELREQWVGQ